MCARRFEPGLFGYQPGESRFVIGTGALERPAQGCEKSYSSPPTAEGIGVAGRLAKWDGVLPPFASVTTRNRL